MRIYNYGNRFIRCMMSREHFDALVEEQGLQDWVEDFGFVIDEYGKAYDSVYDEFGRAPFRGSLSLEPVVEMAEAGIDPVDAAGQYMDEVVSAGYSPRLASLVTLHCLDSDFKRLARTVGRVFSDNRSTNTWELFHRSSGGMQE